MSRDESRAAVRLLFGLGLATLLVLGALGAWAWGLSGGGRGGENLPAMVPHATDRTLGVNADLSLVNSETRAEMLAAMEAAGFRWLRHRFPWDAVEADPGTYDWEVWDEVVRSAERHNLELIAVLDGSPAWARKEADGANALAPPLETPDYGAFVSAFAERYRDQINYYQVWEEPNIYPHWGVGEIDPAAYARLLREAAIQIRSADPAAVILTAALAPNVEPGGSNMSDLLFLEELYQQGAAEWFDVVAAQLYDLDAPLEAPADPMRLNWQRAGLLREVMEKYNDAESAVWAVSAGLDSEDPDDVVAAIEATHEEWPWMGPIVWASWSPGDARGQHALMDGNGRPNRTFDALRNLAAAPVVGWPGHYQADHESARYEGDWRVTPFGADIGHSGDRLTIPFRGTRLDLTVRRGDYRAFLFVTIDGQPANALPRDPAGQAYVVLHDPLQGVDTVTLARGLPDGDHVAEIVAERGWGQWAVIDWTVSREAGRNWPWRWLGAVFGLAALVTLGATIHGSWPYSRSLAVACVGLFERSWIIDGRLLLVVTAGSVLLVYVTVGTLPSLLALGLLGCLLVLRPGMGLPLIAVTLPFYQLGKPLLGKVFSMVEILTLLTAMGWFVNWLLVTGCTRLAIGHVTLQAASRQSRIKQAFSRVTALDWGVIALVAVGALSLSWAEHSHVAAREFRTVILGAALFYGLLRAMVRDRAALWHEADAWVLGGTLVAVVGLLQWFLGQNLITAESVSRVRAFYGSPNNLALYLGRILPLGVAVAVWSRAGRRKWVYGLAAILIAAGILLTFSRGAWLLGVPASLLFLAAVRGRRALLVTLGLLLIAAVVTLLVAGPGRLVSLLDTAEGTTFFRLQLWQSSWKMVRDNPVLGVGLDNFLYHYRSYYVLPTAWEEFNLSHPHNLVLDAWLRLGLPGLAVFAWLVLAFFRRGRTAYRSLPECGVRLLILGLMGGMVNAVVHGLVDNAFFVVDLAFAFMLMLALVQVKKDGENGELMQEQWRVSDVPCAKGV